MGVEKGKRDLRVRVDGQLVFNGTAPMLDAALAGPGLAYVPEDAAQAHLAEQEHYLLISDGQCFSVVDRRAGKFYPLRTGVRHGLDLNDGTVAALIRQSGLYSERDAQSLLVEVASQWRDLFEHVR